MASSESHGVFGPGGNCQGSDKNAPNQHSFDWLQAKQVASALSRIPLLIPAWRRSVVTD